MKLIDSDQFWLMLMVLIEFLQRIYVCWLSSLSQIKQMNSEEIRRNRNTKQVETVLLENIFFNIWNLAYFPTLTTSEICFFLNQNFCFAHGHEVNHLAKESATFTDYQTFTEFLLKLDTMTLWQFTDQLVKHLTKKSLHCRCFFTG